MPAVETPVCDFGWTAPAFTLPGIDGQDHALADLAGPNGLLVMFICNHCPFVLKALDRILADARALQDLGVGVVAICSNDAEAYPADSFENMQKLAPQHGFSFPYLHDADQAVARAYGAACTPDFFGFNADLGLQYRGRLDAGRMGPVGDDIRRDLLEAMKEVAETGTGPQDQIPSMGCSIKWKPAA